jgi:hypothetical protein
MTSPKSSSGESNNAGNNSEADGVRSAPRQPSEPGGQGLAPLRSAPSPAPSEKPRASPTWDEVDAIRKGKSDLDLAERIWHLERELADTADRLEVCGKMLNGVAEVRDEVKAELAQASEIANRETLSAAYWKDKAEAAQEIANEATLLLEGQGAKSAIGRSDIQEIVDCYDARSEIYTNDADCAWAMAQKLRDLLAAPDKTASDKGQG